MTVYVFQSRLRMCINGMYCVQAKQDAEQQQQLAAVQSGLEAILAERADLGSTLKSVQKQLAAASKAADAASQEANAKMVRLHAGCSLRWLFKSCCVTSDSCFSAGSTIC